MKRIGLALLLCAALTPAAHADNVAHCEALIMKVIQDENGQGEAQIASYRPAVHFLASLYDDEEGHLDHMSGFPIRAILCRRNDVIPAKSDYPIIATGIPFVLSQDFESGDTDSLTVYWKEDVLDYVYKGYPLSDEAQNALDARLADFTKRGKSAPADTTDTPDTDPEE